MRANRLREMWAAKKQANNIWLSLGNAYAAEIIAHQGWDSETNDHQHAPADCKDALAMLTAISTTDAVPLVRVPWNAPDAIMRVLDAGAYGVICPMIDTPQQAAAFVDAARYTPLGSRSAGPNRARLYGGDDYIARANDTVLTMAQIETKTALENVAAIAKTPGLDMLFVGPSDLGLSLGTAGAANPTDKITLDAIDEVLRVSHAAGIGAGIFGTTAEFAESMFAKGFDLVTVTTDATMLAGGKLLSAIR